MQIFWKCWPRYGRCRLRRLIVHWRNRCCGRGYTVQCLRTYGTSNRETRLHSTRGTARLL